MSRAPVKNLVKCRHFMTNTAEPVLETTSTVISSAVAAPILLAVAALMGSVFLLEGTKVFVATGIPLLILIGNT
jgi:hypothetical protein